MGQGERPRGKRRWRDRSDTQLSPAEAERMLSPFGRKLLNDLRVSGTAGLRPSKLRIQGAPKEFRRLRRLGLAVALEGGLYWAREVYRDLAGRIIGAAGKGERITIGVAKERTGLSRAHVIALLNRMEADRYLRRVGDERVVLQRQRPEVSR